MSNLELQNVELYGGTLLKNCTCRDEHDDIEYIWSIHQLSIQIQQQTEYINLFHHIIIS